jgi:hypothetical protein
VSAATVTGFSAWPISSGIDGAAAWADWLADAWTVACEGRADRAALGWTTESTVVAVGRLRAANPDLPVDPAAPVALPVDGAAEDPESAQA